MAATPATFHATAVLVGRAGVMITGPSGSGKSTAALSLMSAAKSSGLDAALVGDDRLHLRAASGRLVATVPQAIEALVEVPHLGLMPVRHEQQCVVDLLVELVAGNAAPRMAEDDRRVLEDISLPVLLLPQRSACAALPPISFWLRDRGLISRSFAG